MSGEAIVIKLQNIRKIPGADRIVLADALGNQVITGIDASPEKLYLFFDGECQLSEEFCAANNLYSNTELNSDKEKKGFFGDNRRVRVQKFRGKKSEGFVIELEVLSKLGIDISKIREGDSFTELAGIKISNKYETPATIRARSNKQKQKQKKRLVKFPEHPDTKQFKYELQKIKTGDLIYISSKLHGSSGRYAHISEDIPQVARWRTVWLWFLRLFGILRSFPVKRNWVYLMGTRRVIKGEPTGTDWHGSDDFRWEFMKEKWSLLRRGEIIYGELVGYSAPGKTIMASQSTEKADKSIRKQYGPLMQYKYGCPDGTSKFLVYRITMMSEDGIQFDLPWPCVEKRASELGLETVDNFHTMIFDGNHQKLSEMVEELCDGPEPMDHTHIREGVVLRIENRDGVRWLKHKNFTFRLLEGVIKELDSFVDTEDSEK